jgi:hypothetical protein
MKDLLKETILGAASDSSARDPPPRCHPGTRLAILERCIYFVRHCDGTRKMRWVVGAAGVGKSAIMQSVTESPKLPVKYHASVFLSINGRNEGTKTITTISYQLAAKCDLYRQVIEDKVNRDPSLLQSSMAVQFEKFIVQPFIRNHDLNSAGRVLIIVDGLDECNNTRTQLELLRLISGFCNSYPSSPIVWLVASRPEPHIISFFAKREITSAYEKEEIAVDSNEARADVEQFLRHELTEIGRESNSLDTHWPDEEHLWKLADAAGGLFAYAQTVVRYIGDSNVCDPASQLSDVLNVIDELPMSELSREQHPMALLDALYVRILSNVPPRIMVNARKLLLVLVSDWDLALGNGHNLIVLCNWLGMTADEAYTALNRLRAVLDFPERHHAHKRLPQPFHKSFFDHLFRSGFSSDIKLEARQIVIQCALRVLKEAPNGNACDTSDLSYHYGILAHHRGAGGKISFSWPTQGGMDWNDASTQQSMYQLAIGEVVQGIERGDPVFQANAYIELLITQFSFHNIYFPFNELCALVFVSVP